MVKPLEFWWNFILVEPRIIFVNIYLKCEGMKVFSIATLCMN